MSTDLQTKYHEVENLEAAYNEILKMFEENTSIYNFCYNFEISLSNLKKDKSFPAQEMTAKHWLNETPPRNFFFNHGEHIHKFGGLEHVNSELKNKPSSNRALFTLLSQKEISNSGDFPIPSFLLAQYAKTNTEFYTTHYYRALEVSNFLKINLNEVKQLVNNFEDRIDCKVRITIFAFYAYKNSNFLPLEKFRINTMEQIELIAPLKNGKEELATLFYEMKKSTSCIEFVGIDNMLKLIEFANENNKLDPHHSSRANIQLAPAVGDPFFLEQLMKLKASLEQLSSQQAKGASAKNIQSEKEIHDRIIDEIINHIHNF